MGNKPINPIVGVAVGIVALLIVLGLGYKFFLVPPPLPSVKDHPPRPGYLRTSYPGSAGYPGTSTSATP